MKSYRTIAAAIAFALPLLAAQAQAADIKVFASTAVKGALDELGPQFEKATENSLVYTIGPAATLKTQIDQGVEFDIAILTPAQIGDLVTAGKIDPASRRVIARAGMGVSVQAGKPKPEVDTDEALKRTLLHAASIGYNGVGASRAGNEAMMQKLGIADALKSKIKLLSGSAPEAVAKGEVEIGLGPVSEILPVAGAELAGPFPEDLQSYLVFAAGVSTASKNADIVKTLIGFLTAPAAVPVLKTKGMEPG
jgi:molybdate transport system substrate-binding protein